MKTLKINKLILLLIGLVVFNSCVEDDDFNTPNLSIVEPPIAADDIVEIGALAGELAQAQADGESVYTYEFDDNVEKYVQGYVISSDEGGNFFEEIIIQDKPENPTIGLKVLIDVNPLFIRYEIGRKLYIKLNGLTVGTTNGVLTLGVLEGTDGAEKIPSASENDVIFRSTEVATIVPLPLSISEFTDEKTNLFIQLNDVQFNSSQATGANPMTYASEPSDEFDGERTLESCTESSSVIFSTSTFADFKGLTLPSGRGSMNAILTKNFFGDTFNVVVNTPEDINFDNPVRCDPLFTDDFSQGNLNKWTPYNVTGPQEWFYNTFGNPSDSATMSGFSGGAVENEDWLISLPIDLSGVSSAFFSFDNVKRFTGNDIEVYYATDYNGGDPNIDGTWTQLFPALDSNTGSWTSWVNSGAMDVSDAAGGDLFVAIKYTSTSSAAATWEIDNVTVTVE